MGVLYPLLAILFIGMTPSVSAAAQVVEIVLLCTNGGRHADEENHQQPMQNTHMNDSLSRLTRRSASARTSDRSLCR